MQKNVKMKNLILICLLFVGVYSYASESVVIKKSNVTENVDSLDDIYRCRADITYNGEYVTSTYGFGATADEACANARKAAADFFT